MATYTIAKIDAARITKAGRDLFELMPIEIRQNEELSYEVDRERRDRVKAVLSLMARHARHAWVSMENASGDSPEAIYYYRQSHKYTGEQRDASLRLADKASQEWQEKWGNEKKKDGEEMDTK